MSGKYYRSQKSLATLSVIVPVFNEITIIKQFHNKLLKTLKKQTLAFEVVYVDDNSVDGTYEWLVKASEEVGINVIRKDGKQGKAYSLKQGFAASHGDIIVMIDGDLQYPPEKIPQLVHALNTADVAVATRNNYNDTPVRKFLSRGFRKFFGKGLFKLDTDIQSGLKAFTREVYTAVKNEPKSPWTFDLEFLYRAQGAGFKIVNVPITFAPRLNGYSKMNLLNQSYEIGLNALYLRLHKIVYFPILPETGSMRGAGVGYKGKKYVTHTTLSPKLSAIKTFSLSQKLFLFGTPVLLLIALFLFPMPTARSIVGVFSVLYFVDAIFTIWVVTKSMRNDNQIRVSDEELAQLDESTLPMYTILCPLYKEAHVAPQFLEAISKLDWPKDKLDVMFLLEEEDTETIREFDKITLPYYARTVIVPDSQPKTKPKACNYGLSYAKGKYLVIFDAEDIPAVDQLKKAFIGFQKVPDNVKCLQAKLTYYNSNQNLLTRFFTAEYALWFDITLPGLQSLNSALPLGGTSNHFETENLRKLEGWDPFNVTEDADLGVRLFQHGYRTAIIDSETYEEATSVSKNWLRQRSRWLKGYMQTYLVHMRNFVPFVKQKGLWHQFIFQLTVGGKILFVLLNPFMWIVTALYFIAYPIIGPTMQQIYQPPVVYLAVFSWIFGNFFFLYCYMIALGKRGQWSINKYVLLIPLYWAMMSTAAMIAFYQLLFKPHYWEKTLHGFHLGRKESDETEETVPQPAPAPAFVPQQVIEPVIQPAYIPVEETKVQKDRSVTWTLPKVNVASFLLQGAIIFIFFNADLTLAWYFLSQESAQLYFIVSLFIKGIFIISGGYNHILDNNTKSLLGLFDKPVAHRAWKENKMRILIFNWRDTKHIYAGGAEVYVNEIAKHWVKNGNQVTLFCGNDNKNKSYEKRNGIEIYRRGGTYTVYIFAVLYYLLKFRGKYDVIIDCENGIPFFTPLFAKEPVLLVIHHVHQEIFRKFLAFPLNSIAALLEAKVMPMVYRNKQVITVSDSSRKDILNLGFTKAGKIEIVPNGISQELFVSYPKTDDPSYVYLGRLKEYKKVDVAIRAFAKVARIHKKATLAIVGTGETGGKLRNLVSELNLEHAVTFYGQVSDAEKAKLLSQSWVALQPSEMEGWGITVIEANAAGTPVVASNVNGLRDSVIDGKTGLLVTQGNVTAFANAMMKITEDGLLRMRLNDNAREWAANFDWKFSADTLYNNIGFSISNQAAQARYAVSQ